MELESREGEEQLYKIWTPITHFRNYFAYVHLLNLRHLIIAKLRLFIDVNLWMKRHKPDSPDTRFWQKKCYEVYLLIPILFIQVGIESIGLSKTKRSALLDY